MQGATFNQDPLSGLFKTGVTSVGSFPDYSAKTGSSGVNFTGNSSDGYLNDFGNQSATEIEPNKVTLINDPQLVLGKGGLYMKSELGYHGGELQPGALVQPGQAQYGGDWSEAVNPTLVKSPQ